MGLLTGVPPAGAAWWRSRGRGQQARRAWRAAEGVGWTLHAPPTVQAPLNVPARGPCRCHALCRTMRPASFLHCSMTARAQSASAPRSRGLCPAGASPDAEGQPPRRALNAGPRQRLFARRPLTAFFPLVGVSCEREDNLAQTHGPQCSAASACFCCCLLSACTCAQLPASAHLRSFLLPRLFVGLPSPAPAPVLAGFLHTRRMSCKPIHFCPAVT